MKNLFFILILFLAFPVFAKSPPVPGKKPEIPQIDEERALPEELEVERIPMPEKSMALKPAPEAPEIILCNAEAFDRISVGTKLFIRIFGHEDISRESMVGPKGTVTIPMAGEVLAEGETTATLATHIGEKLTASYIVSQGVEVEIVQYPPIYMIGLVAKPGLYDYRPRLNVRQAVAIAGGFNSRARTSEVRILRNKLNNPLEQTEQMADEDAQVLPGDTIEVLRRWF